MAISAPERRMRILRYITEYLAKNKYPPSFRDISETLQIPSTSTVHSDIHTLIRQGYLCMDTRNYRSLHLNEERADALAALGIFLAPESPDVPISELRDDVYDIPVYGNVAAGDPIYADDVVEETIPLPSSFFPSDGSDYFVLKIRGESMIEAGIFDGDHVIIRRQNTAQNGQQVVALIEDSATVKTFYQHADHVELRPENSAMEPIIVRECKILGIVCGLYRLY